MSTVITKRALTYKSGHVSFVKLVCKRMATNLNQSDFIVSEANFRAAVVPGKFVRLEYLTDLSEFIKTDVLIKQLLNENGVEWLELATGEKIPFDRVVSVSGNLSPHYPGYGNYSCDC